MVVLKGCAGFVYNVLEAAQLLQEWGMGSNRAAHVAGVAFPFMHGRCYCIWINSTFFANGNKEINHSFNLQFRKQLISWRMVGDSELICNI